MAIGQEIQFIGQLYDIFLSNTCNLLVIHNYKDGSNYFYLIIIIYLHTVTWF